MGSYLKPSLNCDPFYFAVLIKLIQEFRSSESFTWHEGFYLFLESAVIKKPWALYCMKKIIKYNQASMINHWVNTTFKIRLIMKDCAVSKTNTCNQPHRRVTMHQANQECCCFDHFLSLCQKVGCQNCDFEIQVSLKAVILPAGVSLSKHS